MTAEAFRAKRRQQFLTKHFFNLNVAHLAWTNEVHSEGILIRRAKGNLEPVGQSGIFKTKLNLLKLYYTAGCDIDELRPLYSDVIQALGIWHADEHEYSIWLAAKSKFDLRVDMTPVCIDGLADFQLAMDVLSLGVLLGEGGAMRQVAQWMQSVRGEDMLFEYLLSPAVTDPRTGTDFFHAEPYDPLIDAFYTAKTPEESSAFVKKYLDGWYKSFDEVPWHDGHLVTTDRYMYYYGYWSFEAAAVCVIHGIDDTSFRDHMVYPKDLADWARADNSVAKLADTSPVRCEAGQPCPREGWWFTPARIDSRRRFAVGDNMPEFESDYGRTIWQWDRHQT